MAYPDKQGKHAQTADKYYIGLAGSQGEHRAHQRCHIEGRPGNCLQGGQGLMALQYAEQGEYQGKAEAVQADLPKKPAQRRIAERRAGDVPPRLPSHHISTLSTMAFCHMRWRCSQKEAR